MNAALINKLSGLTECGAIYAMANRQENMAFDSKTADGHNPVTAIDLAVGEMFQTGLADEMADGSIVLVEEEHLRLGQGETPEWAFEQVESNNAILVLVDPVDGTKGFLDVAGGNTDFGTMCTVVTKGGRVSYARVIMPVLEIDFTIANGESMVNITIVYDIHQLDMATENGAKTARLAQLNVDLKPFVESMGLKVEIWHSAAGMVTSLALGTSSFVTFPKEASLWDIGPAAGLIQLEANKVDDPLVMYFAGNPEELLVLGPHMCKPEEWSLRDVVIVSTTSWWRIYCEMRR